MRTVESEAAMRKVHLGWGTVEDLQVMGNKIKLEQAFVNLLDNAVKFNRAAGEVWVEAGRLPAGKVAISIADSGIGIPSEDLPRIFERFYRVDKARSREVGGTGLGLSIVKHVIEQMQGTVSVESQLNKGLQVYGGPAGGLTSYQGSLVHCYNGTKRQTHRGTRANGRAHGKADLEGPEGFRRIPRFDPWRPPGRHRFACFRREVPLQWG